MSQLHEDLLAPRITKKRIIAVVLVTGFLISFFTFSVYLTSFLFGTQRIDPSEKVEDADFDEYSLVLPPLPDDFKDLLDDIDLDDLDVEDLEDLKDLGIDVDDIQQEDLDELAQLVDEEDIADFLEEINDGDIDNYDLTEAGLIIAALLFSDTELFRVYKYLNPVEDREDILWRYECFDQFNGDGWESTVPKSTMPEHDFPTLDDYWDTYAPLGFNKITLKRPLSTNPGTNSFVLGNLFPEPYIIEETISADNLNPDPALTRLFKDDMESVIADLYFNSAENVSMYYELFGWGINPSTNEEINSTAEDAIYTPNSIKNQFLQLPPNIVTYKSNNPFFNSHWNALNNIINGSDNAFMVANKIRNYLQSNFELSFDELIDDPIAEGEDVVEWFCEKEEGLYSEFASAFCAFTRAFGVSSRFIDGYNSRLIEEFFDPDEGENTYAIKYKNIYDWAEIYVPWDTTGLIGHGQWIQMDVLYESFGEGGFPIGETRFNLTITSNATLPDLTYERGNIANITAVLTNSTNHGVPMETIVFEDITTGQSLGSFTTDSNGVASIEVPIDNNIQVGPHVIKASRGRAENWTYFLVKGDVNVVVTDLSPREVNVSITPHETRVQGFVEDALTHDKLDNVRLNFTLFDKGTNSAATNPFNPRETYTDDLGYFDLSLEVMDYVPYGEYDFRVDFNGTWAIPFYPFPITFSNINDSSVILDFNVTKELTYDLFFSIDGSPTEFPSDPNPLTLIMRKRNDQINLSCIVFDVENGTLASNVNVDFYDYTNGDMLIGSSITGSKGTASIIYTIGNTNKSGPTLVYAKVGKVMNYSYYIVNESIGININSYPNPLKIDLASPIPFNIQCNLTDNKNNPIYFSQIDLRMNSTGDYTSYLTPPNPIYPNPIGSNEFDFDRGVISSTPVNNYTLKLEYYGSFNFANHPYPYIFFLPYLSNSTEVPLVLEVHDTDDIKIYLKVENEPTRTFYDQTFKPRNYTRGSGEIAHFQVRVTQSGDNPPAPGTTVTIWDEYPNRFLDSYTFGATPTGSFQFNISVDQFFHAGIHKIRVQYESYPAINTTFIIINETVNINAIPTIATPRINNMVLRQNEGFTVNGYIIENGTGLRGLKVNLVLFNKTYSNFSQYLIGNRYDITDVNGNFTFTINSISINCPQGEYYIRIDFDGSIDLQETPGINLITNYMVHSNSSLVILNITAGTVIFQTGYHTKYESEDPEGWGEGDTLYVYGKLTWDNTNNVVGKYVNITVENLDGTIIYAFNASVITDSSGNFNGTLNVGLNWPDFRIETRIFVTFYPNENYGSPEKFYIEGTQTEFI